MSEQIDLKSIGARIRELRGRDSRSKFSEGFLVPASSLARWEDGGSQPDLDFLVRLSAGFGVSLSWIITGKDGDHDDDSDFQLGYLKKLDWTGGATASKTGDGLPLLDIENKQQAKITHVEKNKTGDIASFSELRALDKELRTALRENAELQAKYADLRVERERWVAERVRLHHDNEMLRHDNEVLRHELGVYRGTEKSAEYPVQRGAPRTSPPPPDESKEIDAPCTCGTASPLQDPPTNHPRK